MNEDNPSRQDQAAAWFAAQRAGAMLVEQREAFEAWRRDPRNQAALDAMQDLWDDLAVLKSETPPRATMRARYRTRLAAAVALLVAGFAGAAWLSSISPPTIETRPGQQATRSLPDGSLISVNVASRVSYDIGDDHRVATVADGEAAFAVKADAARPFVVRAAAYEVRATGTRFNVRQRNGVVEVAVSEGRVEVCRAAGPETGVTLAALGPGQLLRLPASPSGGRVGTVSPLTIAPEHISEWRMRVVSYENVSVGDLVEDFNRYFEKPLKVEGQSLRDRRVTIRLEVEDRERAIATLAGLLNVELRQTPEGGVLAD